MLPTRRTMAVALVPPILITAGCGAEVKEAADNSSSSATITSCGVQTSVKRPTTPVAYDMSAIEKMFALGLAPDMKIVLPATANSSAKRSTFNKDYAATPKIGDDVLSQEQVVAAKSDWVFAGWQAGFSPERGITPASLKKLDIGSYIQQETCFNYDKGKTAGKPVAPGSHYALENTYADLTNLGAIFGVQDKAKKLVTSLKKRASELTERPERTATPDVFVYDSGTTDPYTSGRRTAPQDIIDLAGGRNIGEKIDARWATMGWESVAKADPDVIVVIDYDDTPVKDKIAYLRNQSPIKNSPAVKNNHIHVMDYGKAVSGPRNLDAAEELSAYFDKKGFK
ncbi:ABC transporter substrate-binding protein [Demetria terragena]|uniref:ABC transporter substrate-binding protein n=1 Tax=Demetria terragena TaxID=63959 RepID=UPI00036038F3|nr:ABC transporter substrate-binding protein [Demetria terragena]